MKRARLFILLAVMALALPAIVAPAASESSPFPPPLDGYPAAGDGGIWQTLKARAAAEPFNVVASVIFLLAIVHTFLAPRFAKIAHRWREEHDKVSEAKAQADAKSRRRLKAEVMHFFGEVEVIFGIWVVPLLLALTLAKGWTTAENYISHLVRFTEPMFVVVIMTMAATRPVLRLAEQGMQLVASLGGRKPAAWWLSILTVGPLLGSFITEPAAMTICALLLARQFYDLAPSANFRYATLGLLFVNVSVGGTFTHFAAPPVLMVASKWDWGMAHMLTHFGWKAALGIVLANLLYFVIFRREFSKLRPSRDAVEMPEPWSDRTDPVPVWVTGVHLFFLGWTVFTAHSPALFIGGFLFFLAFTSATEHHAIKLKPALLVGFFLAGLVVHGGLQGWWIAPLLASMTEIPLLFGAMTLTAFNDNAAITYLASLVPNFSESLKYAVMAGAVGGGGLTVIANAPNPAGQSILSCYFGDGVSPLKLAAGAVPPTAIVMAIFLIFR